MAKYRKIDPRIWNDEKFRGLSDRAQLVFFFVLTHPHMTALGAMRASIPGLSAEKGWSEKAFREAFMEALLKGMLKHDEKACFLSVPNFLRYNRPESPNVIKAWGKSLDYIPECKLKIDLIHDVKAFAKALPEAFAKALPEAFAKGMPYQEQEQEQEQSNHQEKSKPKKKSEKPEYSGDFLSAWEIYPKRAGANPKRRASQAWSARTKQGAATLSMHDGVNRYSAFVRASGKAGTEFVMQAATFFGPDEHYMNDWEIPEIENEKHQRPGRKLSAAEIGAENSRRFEEQCRRDDEKAIHDSSMAEDG